MAREQEGLRFRSARERSEQKKVGFTSTSIRLPEGMSFFTLDSDKTRRVDIIPFITGKGNPFQKDPGQPHYERTFFTHRGIGPNGDTFICTQKTGGYVRDEKGKIVEFQPAGSKCPVCEYQHLLSRDPNADPQQVKDLAPKERQLFLVIDLADPDKGPQLWDVSYHLFGKLLDKRMNDAEEDSGWDMFYHPTKGMSLKLGVTENKGGGYTFFEVTTIDFLPRRQQYSMDILEKVPCLDKLIVIPNYDELKSTLLQVDPEARGKSKAKKSDDDEEDSRKSARRRDDDDDEPKSTRRREDDEEPPAKRKDDDDEPKSTRRRDDDDEPAPKKKEEDKKKNDDFWDDEPKSKKKNDDDDEPPAKSKSRKDDDDEPAPKKKEEPKSSKKDDDWD
jgi:hypothetical protein